MDSVVQQRRIRNTVQLHFNVTKVTFVGISLIVNSHTESGNPQAAAPHKWCEFSSSPASKSLQNDACINTLRQFWPPSPSTGLNSKLSAIYDENEVVCEGNYALIALELCHF